MSAIEENNGARRPPLLFLRPEEGIEAPRRRDRPRDYRTTPSKGELAVA